MPKFLTYKTYDNEDVQVINRDDWLELNETQKDNIFEDISEWVWQETDSKESAIARYDACHDEWADDQQNDSEKDYY